MRARVVGLGLIGGSIGLALRRAGWTVSYVDPDVALADALASGAVDTDRDADPDIALLATTVDVACDVLPQQKCLTMSVCSVMEPLRDTAGALPFVAGHPMAGKSTRGLAAADVDLFAGKRWFIDRENDLAKRVIADCRAEAVVVDAAEHDQAVALTSHIPQILSTALAAYIDGQDVAQFAGSGLATFLRLAASDASVWTPTIEANRKNIEPHLVRVLEIVQAVLEGDTTAFERAQALLRKLERKV
jgi:prephenate dehydrogenase